MRYQFAAFVIGVTTVVVLGVVALLITLNLGSDDDSRRQAAAEAEFRAFEAALQSRVDGLRSHAIGLLQEQAVVDYAARGGTPPIELTLGRISRGGADYIIVSGPGRRLLMQEGLNDSIVNGVSDALDEALYLLDGAVEGGIFEFRDGPVLVAGASTGPGTERAALGLGIRLTPEVLTSFVSDPGRTVTVRWVETNGAPDGVEIAPELDGRVQVVGPVSLSRGRKIVVATIDVPSSALPSSASAPVERWMLGVVLIGIAGVASLGLVVRVMASGVGDIRSGLLAAQEADGNPTVLDHLGGTDEVGRTAAQAAVTLRQLRERTVSAVDDARVATARQLLGEHVIRSMHEGVLVERSDTTCIVCNPAATDLLAVDPSAILGTRGGLRDVLGSDLYVRLQERARNQDASQRLDVVSIAGHELAFDAYEVPEYRNEGNSLLVIVRDVSAVLEVEQLKRDVVSVVSHELRTPLTVIALSLGMMMEPGADQGQLLSAAERNVQRMRELVDDMLDLARLESGQAEPQLEAANPLTLCRDVVEFLRPQAADKQITVREAVDGTIPEWMYCDRKQIQRAVTNLVTNAVKFSPTGTDVWVILRDGGDRIFIDVADSGPGIPVEEQERVFTRFYRASNTREKISGTGLGLPIVRQIAELHGGTASALPAQAGAYFRIELPVTTPELDDGATT